MLGGANSEAIGRAIRRDRSKRSGRISQGADELTPIDVAQTQQSICPNRPHPIGGFQEVLWPRALSVAE